MNPLEPRRGGNLSDGGVVADVPVAGLPIRLPAVPSVIPAARRPATSYAAEHGISEHRLPNVALAISEVLTNVVAHAYPDCGNGEFRLSAVSSASEVEFVVRDYGVGQRLLRPRHDGLRIGLPLAGALCDRLSVRFACPGTEVVMAFHHDFVEDVVDAWE